MGIKPKFKPGQLVEYRSGDHALVGLVKTTQFARRRGDPVFVLVQWCGKYRQQEEYIPQSELKLVEAV
mgnify:CR=1 FL=1|jgi:hypothetical protein|tara:strand:+ start:114 stop:317 length:204 start_codon:yes stop_codon:yes gene_type:complete